MTALIGKLSVGFLLLVLAYYLLVYYKGGTAYIGAAGTAFDNGAGALFGAAKQGYAK